MSAKGTERRPVTAAAKPWAGLGALLSALLVYTVFSVATAAEDKDIARFFGEFRGTAVAEGSANEFGISVRSLNVSIAAARRHGFVVRWSALMQSGDANNPKYRLKLAESTFVPTERAGVYEAVSSTIKEAGEWMSWARVSGDSMTVYQLLIAQDGGFQLTSHERQLTESGMTLRFVRRQDSDVVRVVTGELERIAN